MVFKTKLIGQTDIESILSKVLDDPPHIFITGTYGSGKTTILKEFIETYYAQHKMKENSSWVMNLSSEKDRGIHCIRQNVAEFVRHSSAKKGVYRWIIIDDADSLPIISQQALRRPMETHAHTTRFFFCSRHPSDLIPPLKSRCLHLELEAVSPFDFIEYSIKEYRSNIVLSHSALTFFISLAQTPLQIKSMIQILCHYYKDKDTIEIEDISLLFGSPSYTNSTNILEAYISNNEKKLVDLFFKVWSTGISYEDFLYELNIHIKQLGILKPQTSQRLYYLIMKGWIQYAQGKTHSFDMLRLMLQ